MPLTIQQIHTLITKHKAVSRRQLFRYFERLGITPFCGLRTRPRLYPDDSADRILAELGVPSMAQLADLRRRALSASSRRPAQKRRAA